VGLRPGYDRKAPEQEKWSIEVPMLFLQNQRPSVRVVRRKGLTVASLREECDVET
jgi:hypothetical protein